MATIYEIGSISKTFGSLLLAKAVVEKRANLNDDIRQYLDGTYPNLTYGHEPIRLVHLTNWTAELPDNLPQRMEALRQTNPDSVCYPTPCGSGRKTYFSGIFRGG